MREHRSFVHHLSNFSILFCSFFQFVQFFNFVQFPILSNVLILSNFQFCPFFQFCPILSNFSFLSYFQFCPICQFWQYCLARYIENFNLVFQFTSLSLSSFDGGATHGFIFGFWQSSDRWRSDIIFKLIRMNEDIIFNCRLCQLVNMAKEWKRGLAGDAAG